MPPSAPDDLLATSLDCLKIVGRDGRLMGMNPDGLCLMEIDDFASIKGKAWADLWPQKHRDTIGAAVKRALAGNVARFSADCPTAKGTPKHWDVVVSPVYDEIGNLVHLLSISRDVTREVHIAGERALVTHELSHRIKNLFAIVDGMIGLSARTATDAKSFAKALRARLSGLTRSIAYIYDAKSSLVGPADDLTFHGLMRDLLQPYSENSGVTIAVTGDDHALSEKVITPLALIFNELATNAIKYGALALPGGRLSVSSQIDGKIYRIRWTEESDAIVTAPEKTGFGATLIDRTVSLQLGGAVSRNWKSNGIEASFEIPKEALVD